MVAWESNPTAGFLIADMGPYLGTDWPAHYPRLDLTTFPGDAGEIDYYVLDPATDDYRTMSFRPTGGFSDSYIYTRGTLGHPANLRSGAYTGGSPSGLPSGAHVYVVWYDFDYNDVPAAPSVAPETLISSDYSALGELPPPIPPAGYPNDNIADATVVTGSSGSITPVHYDGVGNPATNEPGEWVSGSGETLWWKWTCPTGVTGVTFTTQGSPDDSGNANGLDTKMAAFDATDLTTPIANNDDDPALPSGGYRYNSRITFATTPGHTYLIQVDQYGSGQQGTIHLGWAAGAPPPPPPPPTPTLSSLSNDSRPLASNTWRDGDVGHFTGTHFNSVTSVRFGGVPITINPSTRTDSFLEFTVTSGSGSGYLGIYYDGGDVGFAGQTHERVGPTTIPTGATTVAITNPPEINGRSLYDMYAINANGNDSTFSDGGAPGTPFSHPNFDELDHPYGALWGWAQSGEWEAYSSVDTLGEGNAVTYAWSNGTRNLIRIDTNITGGFLVGTSGQYNLQSAYGENYSIPGPVTGPLPDGATGWEFDAPVVLGFRVHLGHTVEGDGFNVGDPAMREETWNHSYGSATQRTSTPISDAPPTLTWEVLNEDEVLADINAGRFPEYGTEDVYEPFTPNPAAVAVLEASGYTNYHGYRWRMLMTATTERVLSTFDALDTTESVTIDVDVNTTMTFVRGSTALTSDPEPYYGYVPAADATPGYDNPYDSPVTATKGLMRRIAPTLSMEIIYRPGAYRPIYEATGGDSGWVIGHAAWDNAAPAGRAAPIGGTRIAQSATRGWTPYGEGFAQVFTVTHHARIDQVSVGHQRYSSQPLIMELVNGVTGAILRSTTLPASGTSNLPDDADGDLFLIDLSAPLEVHVPDVISVSLREVGTTPPDDKLRVEWLEGGSGFGMTSMDLEAVAPPPGTHPSTRGYGSIDSTTSDFGTAAGIDQGSLPVETVHSYNGPYQKYGWQSRPSFDNSRLWIMRVVGGSEPPDNVGVVMRTVGPSGPGLYSGAVERVADGDDWIYQQGTDHGSLSYLSPGEVMTSVTISASLASPDAVLLKWSRPYTPNRRLRFLLWGVLLGASPTQADTFDRIDATGTINPASDLGAWEVWGGTWGVFSDQGYLNTASTSTAAAVTPLTHNHIGTRRNGVILNARITNSRGATTGTSEFVIASNGPGQASLSLRFDSSTSASLVYASSDSPSSEVTLMSVPLVGWTADWSVLHCYYVANTGELSIWQDGYRRTPSGYTVPSAQRVTGDIVAFGAVQDINDLTEFWNDFDAASGTLPVRGHDLTPDFTGLTAMIRSSSAGATAVWSFNPDTQTVICGGTSIDSNSTVNDALLIQNLDRADFDMTIVLADHVGGTFDAPIAAWRVDPSSDDGAYGLSYWVLINGVGAVFMQSGTGGTGAYGNAVYYAAGDTVRVRAIGNAVTIWKNGVIMSAFSSTNNSGRTWHGLASRGDPWDHFTYSSLWLVAD